MRLSYRWPVSVQTKGLALKLSSYLAKIGPVRWGLCDILGQTSPRSTWQSSMCRQKWRTSWSQSCFQSKRSCKLVFVIGGVSAYPSDHNTAVLLQSIHIKCGWNFITVVWRHHLKLSNVIETPTVAANKKCMINSEAYSRRYEWNHATRHYAFAVTSLGNTQFILMYPRPLFAKRTDVLPQDIVKPRSPDIRVRTLQIALKFDRRIDNSAVEMPVNFHSDVIIITSNLATSPKYSSKASVRLMNRSPLSLRAVSTHAIHTIKTCFHMLFPNWER